MRRAPSAHNTQPWRFAPAGDGRIDVRWAPERTLPAGDPTGRDLFIALGAAVEGARLIDLSPVPSPKGEGGLEFAPGGVLSAAAGNSRPSNAASGAARIGGASARRSESTLRSPSSTIAARHAPDTVAEALSPTVLPLPFRGGGWGERSIGALVPTSAPLDATDVDLARCLDARHTARVPHLDRPVPREALSAMRAEAERFGCGLLVITHRPSIRRLAVMARHATATQFADPAVHAELWRWLRLDPRDPAYRRDGLTAECLDLRGPALAVARLTMPPTRMRRLTRLGVHHLLALDTQRVVRRSAALCLLTAPSLDRADLVQTGRALLRAWLAAARAGLTTHPVSALLDCADTVGAAEFEFGAGSATPAALFRLGFTPPVPRAPRLPAGELLDATSDRSML